MHTSVFIVHVHIHAYDRVCVDTTQVENTHPHTLSNMSMRSENTYTHMPIHVAVAKLTKNGTRKMRGRVYESWWRDISDEVFDE